MCYVFVSIYEDWCLHASQFQLSDLGFLLSDWPGERWLNTSSPSVRDIVLARLKLAVTKSCDGVDLDSVDGYANNDGLAITLADAVAYLNFLADIALPCSLSIGLENAGSIVPDVVDRMEWSEQEQYYHDSACDLYQPVVNQAKLVFHVQDPKGSWYN